MLIFKQAKFYGHMPARAVKARIHDHIWNSYFKFCVERNPWDKTLSHYHMINHRAGGNLSLDDYLKSRNFCINYPIYTAASGELAVNQVIRYESLLTDLSVVFADLGIPFNNSLGAHAKSNYRVDKRPYQEIYTPQQRAIIENAFSKEIDMHGYNY